MTKPQTPKLFAEGTDVPVERSRAELETLLMKHGATHTQFTRRPEGVQVLFAMRGRNVRQEIENPDRAKVAKLKAHMLPKIPNAEQRRRHETLIDSAYEAELRRRWRSMLLIVKAKLELVASGGSSFEVEFMAHTVLPNGDTVAEAMLPKIEHAYKTNTMPPLMLGPGKKS